MPKTYFIKTYGCQMNKGDSDRLARILELAGYQDIGGQVSGYPDIRGPGIILINTCVVRQNAEDKAAGYINSISGLKKDNPNLIIGVCGCIVTTPGRDVRKEFPHVDVFIAPGQPEMLAEFIGLELGVEGSKTKQPATTRPSSSRSGNRKLATPNSQQITQYVNIMTGCDNFCSYCIVPYVRGREKSKPVAEILKEIKAIDLDKTKEIYLLGQNVNSYKYGFVKLLREIEGRMREYEGLLRIRFMTNHPKDMTDDIIDVVAESPHICEFFHLPIQHGDDAILKSMNRGYTVDQYKKRVDKIRDKIPGAAITSDIIVGYPGETAKQFKNSCKVIKDIGFDAVNTAVYSARQGTAASKLKDAVDKKTKASRLRELMDVVDAVVLKRNLELVGTVQEILVEEETDTVTRPVSFKGEGFGRKTKNFTETGIVTLRRFSGRTRTNKIVKFTSTQNDLIGQLRSVRITEAKSWILKGELLNDKF